MSEIGIELSEERKYSENPKPAKRGNYSPNDSGNMRRPPCCQTTLNDSL